MHRDESLPRALQGTSVDEVADRAARLAVADLEQQQRDEEEVWENPEDDLIASIVPAPVDEQEADAPEDEDEEEKDEAALERAANLKRIRWIGPARTAAAYAAAAQTEIDRAQLHAWEEENPGAFPGEIVYPLAEYPDGRPAALEVGDGGEEDDEEED